MAPGRDDVFGPLQASNRAGIRTGQVPPGPPPGIAAAPAGGTPPQNPAIGGTQPGPPTGGQLIPAPNSQGGLTPEQAQIVGVALSDPVIVETIANLMAAAAQQGAQAGAVGTPGGAPGVQGPPPGVPQGKLFG